MTLRTLFAATMLCLAAISIARGADDTRFRIVERTTQPLMKADRPWEDFCIGYCQVIRQGDTWHMWYASYDHHYKNDRDGMLCYARSTDGVTWEKPNLGLVEYDGNTNNNILIRRQIHGHCVLLDESAPPAERFKLTYVETVGKVWMIFGATSPDGLKWTRLDKPLFTKNSDTQSVCIKDGDIYRLYVRVWAGGDFRGKRLVGYSESKTFGDFPEPTVILSPDEKDPADLQFYNPATAKVRDNLYVMFPSAFYTKTDTVLPHLAVSRDGKSFDRVGREPFIELGKGFDDKTIYVAPGVVATEKPDEYWVYYVGASTGHDANNKERPKYSGGIGRVRIAVSGTGSPK